MGLTGAHVGGITFVISLFFFFDWTALWGGFPREEF
jgi:hypothetical protein